MCQDKAVSKPNGGSENKNVDTATLEASSGLQSSRKELSCGCCCCTTLVVLVF